jgi:hypothetical protein
VVLLVARFGCRVLVPYQRGLLDKVAKGVVVTFGADITQVQPGIVGGPPWVSPNPLLTAGDRSTAAVASQVLNVYLRAVSLELKTKEQEKLTERLEELEEALGQQNRGRWYGA